MYFPILKEVVALLTFWSLKEIGQESQEIHAYAPQQGAWITNREDKLEHNKFTLH